MGNYIFHFENWLGISSSSTYAGQKKTFTRISVISSRFFLFIKLFLYLQMERLIHIFVRMIIINKKTNNAAPLKLMTCLYAVYLKKVPIEKVPNEVASSNNPPKNRRCKQFGNAVSDIVASYLLKFL